MLSLQPRSRSISMDERVERSEVNAIPCYSVMDLMKLVMQKSQESDYFRCELEILQCDYEIQLEKERKRGKVPPKEVKHVERGAITEVAQHIGVDEHEDVIRELRKSTEEEVINVKRDMKLVQEENERLKECVNEQKSQDIER